jgi:dTDP-4-dehydrorhamnose reductase
MKQKLPSFPPLAALRPIYNNGKEGEAASGNFRGNKVRLSVDLPPARLPLLVTGVSGVGGYNALYYFRARYPGRVVGVRPSQTWQLTGPDIVPLDTEDVAGLTALFEKHRFRSVLNTTGNCALKACELDPAMAERTNVVSAVNLAAVARRFECRLVHLSSDLVYSGVDAGNYVETDPVDPVTVYGRTMAEGEAAVTGLDPPAAVLRISLPMGPSFNRHAGAIDWIQSRFRNHLPATLYFDEVRSCTYTDDLNRVFEYFLGSDADGLYHLAGPRPITLYQIAQVINRVGGYAPGLLKGCPRKDAGPLPPRAGNVTMNGAKLGRLLGACPFRAWPFDATFFPTDRHWHFDGDGMGRGSVQLLTDHLYTYPGACAYEVTKKGASGRDKGTALPPLAKR